VLSDVEGPGKFLRKKHFHGGKEMMVYQSCCRKKTV